MPQSNIHLLLIDPQNDFCDVPNAALPVAGASADLQRVAALITQHGAAFSRIHVTLDSHNAFDIAHPAWWTNAAGESPAPFTTMSVAEVEQGIWRARNAAKQQISAAYVQQLAAKSRYQLIIWPEHCLVGSWGHGVQADVSAALNTWSRTRCQPINYVHKGLNPNTEHYSAIAAEVPDPLDAATQPNLALIAELASADSIVVAGEALSHCVANTVRDLADHLGRKHVHKIILLSDCCSSVTGFGAQGQDFIREMCQRGMRIATSEQLWKRHE